MGTWTNQGFIAQSIEDYKTQIQNIFTTAFGSDFNVTDDTLPQNILIQELAELFANADADSIQVLTQLNPNTMSGIWLDLVAMARGLSRQAGTPQVATVSVVSNPSTLPFTISAGQVFTCNETGEQFTMAQATTISSANASIQVKFDGEGDSTAVVGNHLYTEDVPGIITMEIIGLSAGKERESDADFRARLKASAPVFNPTIEHITNEIKILQDIRGVGCAYNDTATTVDGIPPFCTEFLVAPTANVDKTTEQYTFWKENVGKAILWNKVPGSPTFGNTTVNIADPFGTMKDVSFSVPEEISIKVVISAYINEEVGAADVQKIEEIKTNIKDYINGLPVGTDVAYSKIIQIFMAGSAMDVLSVKFVNEDTGVEYTNQNYVITTRQYAQCDNIEVDY